MSAGRRESQQFATSPLHAPLAPLLVCAALLGLCSCAAPTAEPAQPLASPRSASVSGEAWSLQVRRDMDRRGCVPAVDALGTRLRLALASGAGPAASERTALRALLNTRALPAEPACVFAARQVFWALRAFDDEQAYAADPKSQRSLGKALEQEGQMPDWRAGDVILYRDDTPLSAAITQVATAPTDFSHAALVVGGENGASLFVVDVVLGDGLVIESMKSWMRQDYLRVAVYRPRTPGMGRAAANAVLELIERWNFLHRPYDYAMRLDDASEVYCTELLSLAYGLGSRGREQLPRQLSDTSGLARTFPLWDLGVRQSTIFLADDLAMDARFEQLAEVRETGLLLRARAREAAFRRIFAGLRRDSENAQWLDYIAQRRPDFGVRAMYAFAGYGTIYKRMGEEFSARIVGTGRLATELERQLLQDPEVRDAEHPLSALALRLYSRDITEGPPVAGR